MVLWLMSRIAGRRLWKRRKLLSQLIARISPRKAQGNANNDWVVTRDLVQAKGVKVSLEEITETFEKLYQGTPEREGLRETEKLTAPRAFYESMRVRFTLGIVSGRPRSDALFLLEKLGLCDLFDAVVCLEDAASAVA